MTAPTLRVKLARANRTLLCGAASLLSLSGCVAFSFSDYVDYSGSYDHEAGACAEIAMKHDLRDPENPDGRIVVSNIEVIDGSDRTTVEGKTTVANFVYQWECEVRLDLDARTLTASMESFDLVERP